MPQADKQNSLEKGWSSAPGELRSDHSASPLLGLQAQVSQLRLHEYHERVFAVNTEQHQLLSAALHRYRLQNVRSGETARVELVPNANAVVKEHNYDRSRETEVEAFKRLAHLIQQTSPDFHGAQRFGMDLAQELSLNDQDSLHKTLQKITIMAQALDFAHRSGVCPNDIKTKSLDTGFGITTEIGLQLPIVFDCGGATLLATTPKEFFHSESNFDRIGIYEKIQILCDIITRKIEGIKNYYAFVAKFNRSEHAIKILKAISECRSLRSKSETQKPVDSAKFIVPLQKLLEKDNVLLTLLTKIFHNELVQSEVNITDLRQMGAFHTDWNKKAQALFQVFPENITLPDMNDITRRVASLEDLLDMIFSAKFRSVGPWQPLSAATTEESVATLSSVRDYPPDDQRRIAGIPNRQYVSSVLHDIVTLELTEIANKQMGMDHKFTNLQDYVKRVEQLPNVMWITFSKYVLLDWFLLIDSIPQRNKSRFEYHQTLFTEIKEKIVEAITVISSKNLRSEHVFVDENGCVFIKLDDLPSFIPLVYLFKSLFKLEKNA